MIISLPLPLKSDGVPPNRNAEGLLTLDVPGFGQLVQVPADVRAQIKARVAGSLVVIGAEITFTAPDDPYNGLWLREYDYKSIKKELGNGSR